MLGENAAHHRQFSGVRRVVDEIERRLGAAAGERGRGRCAKPGRNDHRDARLAAPHGSARIFSALQREREIPVGAGAGNDVLRDWRAVLVDDGNGHPHGFAVPVRTGKDRPEERRDRNRHEEAHDHGATIAEEQLKVLSDHGDERYERYQSRKLLPVSDRNTDSRLSRCPPTAATPVCSPRIVSSAITLPWSMITTRSASRSASSM